MSNRCDIVDVVVQALEEDEVNFPFEPGGTVIELSFMGDDLLDEPFEAAAGESASRSAR